MRCCCGPLVRCVDTLCSVYALALNGSLSLQTHKNNWEPSTVTKASVDRRTRELRQPPASIDAAASPNRARTAITKHERSQSRSNSLPTGLIGVGAIKKRIVNESCTNQDMRLAAPWSIPSMLLRSQPTYAAFHKFWKHCTQRTAVSGTLICLINK